MQKHLNDLRNPVQSSPAQVGLAASPAQSEQGSTTSGLFTLSTATKRFQGPSQQKRIGSFPFSSLSAVSFSRSLLVELTKPALSVAMAGGRALLLPSSALTSPFCPCIIGTPLAASCQAKALEGAPLAGKASGAIAQELPPVGNTGGSFRSVPNV